MEKTKIPTLDSILEYIGTDMGLDPRIRANPINIDDIFRQISNNGIKSVGVNREQMSIIVTYFMSNFHGDKAFNVARTGKVDKFWGVKLIEQNG